MSKSELTARLLRLPTAIHAAELGLLEIEADRLQAAQALQVREDALLLAGVDGKNEATRQAQLREATSAERERLQGCERERQIQQLVLHRHQNEFAAARSIARLLAGSTD